jgi:hypothetical protein
MGKWTGHFSNEEKYMKKHSACSVIRKMQMNTTLRFYLTAIRMATIKKITARVLVAYT